MINAFKHVPSVLLTPTWVTAANVEKTVIKDKVIKASALCTTAAPKVQGLTQPSYAADCKMFGIK